jgi:hypothetical protein
MILIIFDEAIPVTLIKSTGNYNWFQGSWKGKP